MVRLNRIYTRTGDEGTTGLTSGERLPKNAARVEAMGAVDETNSAIGIAREQLSKDQRLVFSALARIQNDLFDLGADVSSPAEDMPEDIPALRIVQEQVDWLEQQIDLLNSELEPLKSFVLPAGGGAWLHMARATCRRAERCMVALRREQELEKAVSPVALRYINRLSDYLFVAARYVNNKGQTDILWQPAASRTQDNS